MAESLLSKPLAEMSVEELTRLVDQIGRNRSPREEPTGEVAKRLAEIRGELRRRGESR